MKSYQSVQLRKESVQQIRLHIQVCRHPLAEHLLDHLQQLTVMLLRDDELVDVLLTLGLVSLQSRGHSIRHGGRPGLGLLPLDPQEGVGVEVAEADGESLGKLFRRQELCVKKILSVSIHLFSVLSRFTKNKFQ